VVHGVLANRVGAFKRPCSEPLLPAVGRNYSFPPGAIR
jgi:hypothetical protein